jgi:hypothetical protein
MGMLDLMNAGLGERSKVQHLINGIKIDKLETVKTQVLSTPALRSDSKGEHCELVPRYDSSKTLMNKAGRDAYIAALTTGKEVVPDMIIDDQQRRT